MSLNSILNSALSGLAAAQAGLNNAANNIANYQTPGYARERSTQNSVVTSGATSGVTVGEPQRIADQYLEGAVYSRAGDAARSDTLSTYYDRLQGIFGAPVTSTATGNTDSNRLDGYAARISAVVTNATGITGTGDPTEDVAKFTASVEDAIEATRTARDDANGLIGDVSGDLGTTVARINTLLQQVQSFNDTIASYTAVGRGSGALADQRMSALQELTGLIDLRVVNQPDGRVSLDTATGVPLLDSRLRQIDGDDGLTVKFAGGDGQKVIPTGDSLATPAVGGKLGALLQLRDQVLPETIRNVGTIYAGLAEATNRAANGLSAVPAPHALVGSASGLVAADRLGFTGAATFGVVDGSGRLVAKTKVDFGALGSGATVQTALDAINAGLGGAATATLSAGVLTLQASNAAFGVAVAQDPTSPSDRAGLGFSQLFGLNDVIRSTSGRSAPIGLDAADPSGFTAGQSVALQLRDATGTLLASHVLTGSGGPTVGDLVGELNGAFGASGSFALDARGRIAFAPNAAAAGATVSIVTDNSDRLGTGVSFGAWSGLGGYALDEAAVSPALVRTPGDLPLARFDTDAAVGAVALGRNDVSGATDFINALNAPVDLGTGGTVSLMAGTTRTLGAVGTGAARASTDNDTAGARLNVAISRRDNFSGVDVSEEMSQMIVLQNSYAASARVVTVTSKIYDTLLAMV